MSESAAKKKIAETTTINELGNGGFCIGAAVSGARLAEHAAFRKAWPGVLEAVNLIGRRAVPLRHRPPRCLPPWRVVWRGVPQPP